MIRRVIRYRAIAKTHYANLNGKMITGYLVNDEWIRPDTELYDDDGCELYFEEIQIDPKTIGMYTGFRDIHGTDIYEDDIVIDDSNRLMKVIWHNAGFKFEAIKETNFKYADLNQWFENGFKIQIKVIGNIHDNKVY